MVVVAGVGAVLVLVVMVVVVVLGNSGRGGCCRSGSTAPGVTVPRAVPAAAPALLGLVAARHDVPHVDAAPGEAREVGLLLLELTRVRDAVAAPRVLLFA